MTAATLDDAASLHTAPRRSVEDAWRTLNRRYLNGALVLLGLLVVLPWAFDMGPNGWRAVGSSVVGTSAVGASGTGASGTGASTAARSGGATPGSASSASGSGAGAVASGSASSAAGAKGAASGTGAGAGAGAASGSGSGATGGSASAMAAAPTTGAGTGTAGPASAGANAAGAGGLAAIAGAPVARLYFEPDQAWPTGEVGPRIAPVLARAKAEPDAKVLVSGYHDRRGSVERNEALAKRRAETVRNVLVREGVATDRIVLAKPQQSQGSGPDREARRVEVTVAR